MRSTRSRLFRLLVLLLSLTFLAAACGGDDDDEESAGPEEDTTTTTEAAAEEPTIGGELTFGAESDVASLLPGVAAQPSDKVITLGIFDPLTTYDDEGQIVPFLAESIEGDEALEVYTVKLRSGVKFHDGTDLNADAVIKHFDRLKDPATGCPCKGSVDVIASMASPDPLTVVFTLGQPSVAFPDLLAGSSGYIESPTAVQTLGADFARKPVGTGPFTLAEFTTGERVVLEKNPNYWREDEEGRKLPYLDRLIVRPIPDANQRLAALKAGDVDIIQTATSNLIAQAEEDGIPVQKVSGSSSTIILMNHDKPPFNEVEARQALAYAINKDAINEAIYDGVRVPSYSGFAPDSPYFNADAQTPKFDQDKARELVDGLGGLEFSLVCIPTPESQQILELVKNMGEAVGMEIELQTQEQGQFVNRMFSKGGDYEAACFRSSHFIEPDAIRPGLTTDDPGNLIFYSNPDVDRLLNEGRQTTDFDERKELYDEVQEITAEEVPLITLLYDLFGNIYREGVHGLPTPEFNSLGAIKPATLWAE